MLNPVPDDVINVVRRSMSLVARAKSGEYGDVAPEKMAAIHRLESTAIHMSRMISQINVGVGIINKSGVLADDAAKKGDKDLASAIKMVTMFSDEIFKASAEFVAEMTKMHDKIEDDLSGEAK
jgi:hypothetical protein